MGFYELNTANRQGPKLLSKAQQYVGYLEDG